MITEEQVRGSLETVIVPGVMRSLVKLNLIRQVSITNDKVDINIASTCLSEGAQRIVKAKALDVLRKLPGVGNVELDFVEATTQEVNEIGGVIAVMSGKGGVGKSLVTGLVALSLMRKGYEVGILDADITGPSIPKMFGITDRPSGTESGIMPVLSHGGIGIMSVNLLLPNEDDAVIWRGPLIGKAITQFWEEVLWGKLDYLIVDLPPGTADAPLTVMQSLPLSGVIIVSSPQELAAMVVRKAVKMAQESMSIPILGVVENMSYFVLPDSGKKIEIFGKSRGEEMARVAGAPLLAQIPIDSELARLCDEGEIEKYHSEILTGFTDSLLRVITTRSK